MRKALNSKRQNNQRYEPGPHIGGSPLHTPLLQAIEGVPVIGLILHINIMVCPCLKLLPKRMLCFGIPGSGQGAVKNQNDRLLY